MDVGRGIFSDNLHVVGQSIIMHMMHVCIDCLSGKREERICSQCIMGETEDEKHFWLRWEDLKQEKCAVLDCIMELESEFLTANNEKR